MVNHDTSLSPPFRRTDNDTVNCMEIGDFNISSVPESVWELAYNGAPSQANGKTRRALHALVAPLLPSRRQAAPPPCLALNCPHLQPRSKS